jgi:hypothetical protein
VQQLYAFDKNSYVGNLKTRYSIQVRTEIDDDDFSMKNLAESIANVQLRDYEPDFDKASPFVDFKVHN